MNEVDELAKLGYHSPENPRPTKSGERTTGSYIEQGPEIRPYTRREKRRLALWTVIFLGTLALAVWSVVHK